MSPNSQPESAGLQPQQRFKQWRYIFHMEDGRQTCIGEEYIGTEPEAMLEGENRLFEHLLVEGETPASIEVQSLVSHAPD